MAPRILVGDTETTGTGDYDRVCELAFVEIDEELYALASCDALINPEILICPTASAASGITNRMVENEPVIEEILARYGDGYFSDVLLVAHNAQFDAKMLRNHWNITGTLCTYKAARTYIPEAPNHKLQTLRYYLDLDVDGTAHRAYADVLVTYELLIKLLEISGKGIFELAEETMTPKFLSHMPFGKHKGKLMTDLPASYVHWLIGLPDLDMDVKFTLQQLQGLPPIS